MTAATWITMIVVLGFVWGGFLWILSTAVRKEGEKRGAPPAAEGRASSGGEGRGSER